MMANGEPGGHGERPVAAGTFDMAVRGATAETPASRSPDCWPGARREANPRILVRAAGRPTGAALPRAGAPPVLQAICKSCNACSSS